MSQIWAQGRSYGAVTKGMDQRGHLSPVPVFWGGWALASGVFIIACILSDAVDSTGSEKLYEFPL